MPLKRDQDNFGLEAFRQALERQEGSFMRAATVILNPPKRLTGRPISSRGTKASDTVGQAVVSYRNDKGQFVRKSDD